MKKLACFLTIILFLLGGFATIQADEVDLVKMSKKEKERKKNEKKKPIVITNNNINTVKINNNKTSYFSITKIETGEPGQTKTKKKNKESTPKEPIEYWQKRKTKLDQDIAKLEADIKKNNDLLDELFEKLETSELSDVEGNEEEDNFEDLEMKYEETEDQIKKDTHKLAKKKKELQELFNEVRQAGISPGTLR